MTTFILTGFIILMFPLICQILIIYAAYFQWALGISPLRVSIGLNKQKQIASPTKKVKIGFPVEPVPLEVMAKRTNKGN